MAVQAMQAPAFQQGLAEIEGDWAVEGCRGLVALLVMLAHYGVFLPCLRVCRLRQSQDLRRNLHKIFCCTFFSCTRWLPAR